MCQAPKKAACFLAVLMAFAPILHGCSGDEGDSKASSRAESAKTEAPALNIEISQPQFDQSKQGPKVDAPKKRGSPLDF